MSTPAVGGGSHVMVVNDGVNLRLRTLPIPVNYTCCILLMCNNHIIVIQITQLTCRNFVYAKQYLKEQSAWNNY